MSKSGFTHLIPQFLLVGGSFNPFEKYQSKSEFSPNRGEDKTCLKPPPSFGIELGLRFFTRLLNGIGCCFNNTLMVQKSGLHKLRLVVSPIIYNRVNTSQVVGLGISEP